MKNIKCFLLLFCCLLITGQVWAVEYKVTNLSGSDSEEGSFLFVMKTIADGDIITFDESLNGKTIQLVQAKSFSKKFSYTINGNGVIIKQNITFANSTAVTIKNINFDSSQITFGNTKEAHIINCTFNEGSATKNLFITCTPPSNGTKFYCEGCYFISKSNFGFLEFKAAEKKPISSYFTSCTFYNDIKSEKCLFYHPTNNSFLTTVLTNCVIVDSNEKISNFPITTGGYNVIKGGLYESSTFNNNDIYGTDIEDPIIIVNSIPKVRKAGGAYLHFPKREGLTFPEGVNFPEKDIEGTTIDYSQQTHSGVCQGFTDVTIIPVTGISLNKTTAKFTLSGDEVNETLEVTPIPDNATFNASLITWQSGDEKVATVKDGLITAVAPGKTTITATYNNNEHITASCQVEVTKHRMVTTNASSGEGSFNALLPSLQGGDTIVFMEGLGEIELTSETIIDQSITLLGNGVTLTSNNLKVTSEGVVTFENMNFKNSGIFGFYNEDTLYIRNCRFEENQLNIMNGYKAAIYAPASKALVVEGSLFISNAKGVNALFANWDKGKNVHIHLTSCSFINTANESEPISYSSPGNIIYIPYKGGFGGSNLQSPPEITLTNCVIQDNPPRNGKSASPAIAAPCIRSNGYNVIKGLIAKELKGTENAKFEAIVNELSSEKGDIVNASMQNPVIKADNLYKVVTGRFAAGRLPANTAGVKFPDKDLTGTTIDYGQATHSGAVQATTEANAALTGMKLFSLNSTANRGIPTPLEIIWLPEDAAVPEPVTWESSDQGKATVENGIVTAVDNGEVTITAKSGEIEASLLLKANGIGVEEITLDREQDTLFIGYPVQLAATVLPENASYKTLSWESSALNILSVDEQGNLTPLSEGIATITAQSLDNGSASATCTITVQKPDYTTGVFLVNEDWYTHFNGTVNYLADNGEWLYRVVQHENPGRELGATTQFGAIYGDKFYLVSKQEKDPGAVIIGSRFAVCDAKTMKIENEFTQIGYEGDTGDGRSFLGVDEKTGYVSTSNGIYIYDFGTHAFTGKISGAEGDGQGSGSGSDPGQNPDLYTGQVGTMLRIGDRVFANHQKKGLLVINPETNKIDTVLGAYHFTAIVQSKDGYLWAGTTQDISGGPSGNRSDKRIIKIDPYTLDMTEIPLTIDGPYANWGAWRADAFCASAQENKLYWRNMPTFFGTEIYEYDIATGSIKTILDLTQYENGKWRIYETGFRIDPVTNLMYISITAGYPINWGGEYNRTLKLDLATNSMTTLELDKYYWFPAMYVFPDNASPVVSGISNEITLDKKDLIVDLPVTDADNMDAAIVKTVSAIGDPELISATIVKNQLHLTKLKEPEGEAKTSAVTLKFNSNGKIVEKTITVKVAKPTPGSSISISHQATTLTVGETSQLTATILPEDATYKEVTWKSSDNTIVSVTENGQIRALKVGTATITVESVHDDLKAECVVTAIKQFELDKQSLKLYVNQRTTLTTNAEAGQSVEWSTSDESVVTVDNGQITALKEGYATITAQNKTTGQSSHCEVSIYEGVLKLDKQSLELHVNQMEQLTASTEAGLSVEWSTSDASVATVNNGQVVALKAGNATITARNRTIGKSASCRVTVHETGIMPDVDVEETSAYIIFPRLEEASYYLVHVYKRVNGMQTLAFTLKVGSDGSILRSTKAEASDINIYLPNLEISTEYITVVEAMRTNANGKDEVIQVLTAPSFTAGSNPTGNEQASTQKPEVYYHDNTLLLEGMEGYTCYLVTLNGQIKEVFEVHSSEETYRINLSAGVYLLTGTNGEKNMTFKFIAK